MISPGCKPGNHVPERFPNRGAVEQYAAERSYNVACRN
jgi:hypothetical protein